MKLKEGRLRLDVRGKFFAMRVGRCWNSCPERLWMPRPSLEVLKARLDGALGSLGWYEMGRLVALHAAVGMGAFGASRSLRSFPTRAVLCFCDPRRPGTFPMGFHVPGGHCGAGEACSAGRAVPTHSRYPRGFGQRRAEL